MRERKYTLPRHTILASNGSRTGAFLIDLFITILLTMGLFYGVFSNVFKSRNDAFTNTLNNERYASHLFFEDENGELDSHDKDTPNQRFVDDLHYYYTVYLDEGNTTEWFNVTILDVSGAGKDFFKYQIVDGIADKTLIAVFKEDVSEENANIYLQEISDYAINYSFNKIPKVNKMIYDEQFSAQLTFICALVPSILFSYLLMPLCFKNGITIGKKAFGLALANASGYEIKSYQILLRLVPLAILIAALFIPIWSDLLLLVIVFLTIFLVSFALCMASPKRMSLHDFCAATIVIDKKASVIFDNEEDEIKYIENEDKDVIEEILDARE